MSRILLLLTTRTYRAGAFLDAADILGHQVTVGSERVQALEILNPAGHLHLELHRLDDSLERIGAFAARHRIDAVIAADDECSLLAAAAAERLGFAAHSVKSVETARDKLRAREAFARAGLPTPQFLTGPLGPAGEALADQAPYPCVLKPRGLAASRGVIRADDPEQFRAAHRRIARLMAVDPPAAPGEPPTDQVLVESFIPGVEVAVEGLVTGGALRVLAIFDKPDPLDGPYFEETLYVTPSRLEAGACDAIARTTARAVEALGLQHGPIHAELRWDGTQAWPLEIAPRSIGGLCSRALRFGAGHTLEMLLLRHALGETTARIEREPDGAGVMMLPIPRAGILRGVGGIERARAVPGITDVRITLTVGSTVVPLPEGAQYLGFLFARGPDPAAVEAALRAAHDLLNFDIESVSADP